MVKLKNHICKICGCYFKSEDDSPNCCIFCEEELGHLDVKGSGEKCQDQENKS